MKVKLRDEETFDKHQETSEKHKTEVEKYIKNPLISTTISNMTSNLFCSVQPSKTTLFKCSPTSVHNLKHTDQTEAINVQTFYHHSRDTKKHVPGVSLKKTESKESD